MLRNPWIIFKKKIPKSSQSPPRKKASGWCLIILDDRQKIKFAELIQAVPLKVDYLEWCSAKQFFLSSILRHSITKGFISCVNCLWKRVAN